MRPERRHPRPHETHSRKNRTQPSQSPSVRTADSRKRVKHVWTYWGAVLGQLRPALAAHHRLGKSRDDPNPIQAFVRAAARGDSLGGDPFGVPG